MQCPYYYANYECLDCNSLQDCEEWPYKMTTEAPDNVKAIAEGYTGDVNDVVNALLANPEFAAHMARVSQLVALLNGVIKGLASNPLMLSMLPADIVAEMQKVE